jgi:nucleoside-diphosphate-sugar epimerase
LQLLVGERRMRVLIVGCGYVGRRAAALVYERGDSVHAMTRSPARAAEWQALGWRPVVADVMQPETLVDLPTVDLAIYSVGYDRQSGVPKRDVYVDGLRNALRAIEGRCGRIVYSSSTSVYEQSSGEIVNEDSPAEPDTDGGRICLKAERALANWSNGAGRDTTTMIIRFAGLYGPGRLLARSESLRSGAPLAGRADAWLNLIHRDDAARLAVTIGERGRSGRTYLGVDDEPVRRTDFYTRLAELVGAPPPTFDGSAIANGRGSATGLNKRCDGSRIRGELGFGFDFPTYREGLASALRT